MYSIRDHLSLDPVYFENSAPDREQQMELLQQTVETLQKEQGWLCFVDVVLNHAARNAEWVLQHPEVTYNT